MTRGNKIRSDIELDRRAREVLNAVIRTYAERGEPVGSRTVARVHPEDLSPSTIRNIMADLEEMGLLKQPHTSAGRIPTDLAYRLYVDSLSGAQPLDSADLQQMLEAIRGLEGNVDQVLEQVSHFLSSLSNHIGVALRSSLDQILMKRMEFIALGNRRVLALFVSMSGVVSQKMIRLDEDLSWEDLDRVGRYLTDTFGGKNLQQIREQLLAMMAEEKALYDELLAQVLSIGRLYFDESAPDSGQVFVDGAFHLVGLPEFANAEQMRSLFRAFEEKGRLVKILNRCLEGEGPIVMIGAEQGDPEMTATSLVASPFFFQDRVLGTLGVIGPTRMEYPRIMAMVDHVGRLVSQRLSGT